TDTANATATYESSDTSVATVSEDGTVTIVGIGAATITASVHETDNYNSGSVGITLTVEKKDSTLTVTEVAYEVTYGDASFNLEVTSEGGTVTYTSSDEDVVTVDSDGNVTITGAGEATITLSIADGDNYNGTSTTVTVKVNEAALKDVSVEQDGTLTYDGTAQTAAVKASAETVDGTDDDVTFTYSTSENGEYTTEVPAFTDAGTYTVYYRAEAANHEAVSGSFTVTIAAKSVTASISGTTEKTYDGTTDTTTDQGLSIELSGVVDGDTVTATATGYAYNSAEVESADTITATDITLSGEDAGNYTLSDDTATVAGSITARTLRESDFTVDTDEETYSGSAITKTIVSSLTEDTDYAVTYANNTNAGTATITIAGTGNYTGSLTNEFIIEPKEITVSISGTTGNVYGGTITAATATLDGVTDADEGNVDVTLTYTGTANDGTEYESTEVPTLAGTYTVTATISDSNYSLTGTTTADFTVGRAASGLSVGVDLTLDKTYGDEAFAMSATWTDTANATATYASDNTDIATVDDDGTVTIVGAGTATITVSVSESANYNSGSVEITLTVEKKDSTLTVAEVAYEVTYGDDPFNLEVTSEGGTVTYTSSDEDVATVDSDGNVTITGAGEATITLSIADGDNYNGTSKTVTVKVNEAALTDASVEQDGTLTYDGTAQTAAVTASAATVDGTDDDVTFTYSTSENGEYSAAVPAFTDAGTYTVYYRAEAANHETVSGSFTVTIAAKSATVSISGTTEKTYDGTTDTTTDQGLSIELSGVVEGDDVTASATSYTYDSADVDSASTITATGITLSGEDAGNYMLSDDTATVAGCISARTLSESDFTVDTDEETYSGSAITKTIVSSLTEDTDYAVTYANNTNAGTATITIAGTGNYTGSLTNEFIIEPKEITVSISGTTGNVYGGTITAATATLDGVTDADEGNVDVTLTYTGTANDGTEYESTEVPTLAGTYTVTATISDSNYSLTGTTTAEFVIAKATYDMSGVSFADATYTYDGTEKTLTITGSESLPDGVTVSYTDNSLTDAGSIEVTATFSGDVDNYEAIESKTATLTIIKADFILTVTGYEGVYDEDAHSITVTAEDGVTVTYSAAEDSGFSEENLAYTDAGTYTVYYKASKANYNDVTGSATVVITQAEGEGSVSITGWTYGDYDADTNSPVPVSATNGTEDVTYLYKVQDADDSTYTSTVPTDAGSYTVQATFAATNNYKAGTATADFTIAKAASGLSVGVDLELDKTYGDDAFALSAVWTDTANATATYESSDTSVAAVSDDGTVTIVGAGTATITVSVSETDNYSSGSVEITLTVEKKDSTLTVTEAVYEVTYGDASFTLEVTSEGGTVTYTSSDEDVATVDSDGNVTITGAGEATITLSIADGDNYNGTSKTVTVKVNEAALTDASVEQDGTLTYDGTAQTAAVTASAATVDGTDDDVTFTYSTSENGEYSAAVPAFTDAGTYTVYYRAEAANHETVSGSFTVTIAAKSVTVSISGTTEKTYDGTTDTTTDQGLSIELSGVVDGDTVTATATGYAYNSAEVESADTITATDITLSGEDAGNYTLSDDTATVAGSITARTLRESDFTVDTDEETYSGSAI
ncbi:MAG: YDG domain-containing protein, partial [Lachnospiraceae bacterium]|nr:YDG domain-containing protein [Lachnospiraceae bacterium]